MENPHHIFDQVHEDLVTSTDYNIYGTRMVAAGADHYLEVWDVKDDDWRLVDRWRGHEAEISEVRWNGPQRGEIFGSIGEDCKFNLWEEDLAQPPCSGRRFQQIYRHSSPTRLPYMSVDFKTIGLETYIALITRDGYLNIIAPVKQNSLKSWQPLLQNFVCPAPPPTADTSFRVCFHQERLPSWKSVIAGLDKKCLSLAVLAMNVVQIYRTDKKRQFYEDCELISSEGILFDVAWANGSTRGFDVIATAGKDGRLRIYELHVARSSHEKSLSTRTLDRNHSSESANSSLSHDSISFGRGAVLVNANRGSQVEQDPSRVRHEAVLTAVLEASPGAVWRLHWSFTGDVLFSVGDDGDTRSWKKDAEGTWLEYADVTFDDDESEESDFYDGEGEMEEDKGF